MRVTVINGSPKGNNSISLQSILYLQKHFTEDEFTIINAGAKANSLRKDFSSVTEAIRKSDMILFCYPVYTFLAPSQLHSCMGLIKQNLPEGLEGKFAAQFTTSKHFYDITAHEYIRQNCEDLNMTWLDGMSADMDDLLTEKGRDELKAFWKHIKYLYARHKGDLQPAVPAKEYDIVLVTNSKDDEALDKMISSFIEECPSPVRIVNIAEYPIKGGCLGCFHCAADGTCIYNDGFPDLLRNNIFNADAIIYAYTIKDHSMGADFKMYDDRQFCNGHRMMTIGMPVGYLVNGDLNQEYNLINLMNARAQVGKNTLCGIVSSVPYRRSVSVSELSDAVITALNTKLVLPQNFWGVGGTKIFRDLIYLMRGIMKADHKFYKEEGIYDDFPQKHRGTMLKMMFFGYLMNNKKIRAKMGSKMDEGMLAPYKKAIEKN